MKCYRTALRMVNFLNVNANVLTELLNQEEEMQTETCFWKEIWLAISLYAV